MRLFLIAAAYFSALASSAMAQIEPPVSTPEQRQAQAEQNLTADMTWAAALTDLPPLAESAN